MALILLLTQLVSFRGFENNTSKYELKRIDVVGGCGPYNKTGYENLVCKT